MAHSWVQLFDTELEDFQKYAQIYPDNCTLLVDTYNVLKSGIPNAIKVFDEIVVPSGHRPKGVRIDSGDIAYLSKKARVMLDEAGYQDVGIVASNSLDEYIIRDLLQQGAKLDSFGIGERLITSKSDPVFGGVYKLVAVEKDGAYQPKIKVSESLEKITNPCFKRLYRLYNADSGKAEADYICTRDEELYTSMPITITIFDPVATWKQKTLENVWAKELLEPIFVKGKLVYQCPPLEEVRAYCAQQVDSLWDEVKRFENPHSYYVDLSEKLWNIKNDLLKAVQK